MRSRDIGPARYIPVGPISFPLASRATGNWELALRIPFRNRVLPRPRLVARLLGGLQFFLVRLDDALLNPPAALCIDRVGILHPGPDMTTRRIQGRPATMGVKVGPG